MLSRCRRCCCAAVGGRRTPSFKLCAGPPRPTARAADGHDGGCPAPPAAGRNAACSHSPVRRKFAVILAPTRAIAMTLPRATEPIIRPAIAAADPRAPPAPDFSSFEISSQCFIRVLRFTKATRTASSGDYNDRTAFLIAAVLAAWAVMPAQAADVSAGSLKSPRPGHVPRRKALASAAAI